jgi:hypothetical protein
MNLKEWILLHGYLKVVKNKLPDNWIKPAEYRRVFYETNYKKFYQTSLFEEEILLNYFELKPTNKTKSRYHSDEDYIKAVDALKMIEEQLIEDELIVDLKKSKNLSRINIFILTNEGVKKAKKIYREELEKIKTRILELENKQKSEGLSDIEKKEQMLITMKLLEYA